VVWWLAAGKLIIFLLTMARYGYFRDELYNLACSRHLAWGYVDHPPAIAGITWAITHTLGNSLYALRLAPALIMSGMVVLGGALARRMGGDRFAQGLTALALCLSPAFWVMGTILTVNAFDMLAWAVVLMWVLRMPERPSRAWWCGLGGAVGLGLLIKFSMAFLVLGLVVASLLTSWRRYWRGSGPWLAAAVATIVIAPWLGWERTHGWPTLEFFAHIRAHKNYPVSWFEFVAMQFAVVHPCIFPIAIAGTLWLLRDRGAARLRLVGWTYVVLFGVLAGLRAKFYYLFPIYPVMLAAGGIFCAGLSRRGRVATVAVMLVGGMLTLPLAVPVLPLDALTRYNAAIDVQRHIRFERGRDREVPIIYADMLGWPELAEEVARVVDAVSVSDDRNGVTLLTANYGQAAALDFFGVALGLPPARCPHNAYHTWGPGDQPWGTVIAVGFDAATLAECFERVDPLGVAGHPRARERVIAIHRCCGLKLPIDELWKRLKRYG
jgi:4-amino-4-deoxy-L-arabinose transferase-like glycosyltransferase